MRRRRWGTSCRCRRRSACSTRVRGRRPPTACSPASGYVRRAAWWSCRWPAASASPHDAESVALNVTADAALEGGFVTVFACGSAVPNASNLNYAVGQTIANAVITRIGTDGTVCLYNFGATNLIADVTGYFPTDAFEPLEPAGAAPRHPAGHGDDRRSVRRHRGARSGQHPGAPGRRAGRRARHGRCRGAERHRRRSQGRRVRHRVRLRRRATDGVERQLRERTDDRQRRRHPRRRQWCCVLLHRRCHRPDRRRRRCVPRCDLEHVERAATTARHPARPVDVRWLVRRWRRAAGRGHVATSRRRPGGRTGRTRRP